MNHSCEKCLFGADCSVPDALFSSLRPPSDIGPCPGIKVYSASVRFQLLVQQLEQTNDNRRVCTWPHI